MICLNIGFKEVMMQAVYNAIIGVVSGALFGWIIGQTAREPRFPRNNEKDLLE
jgi:membrane protein YqaA with SNARE-associated domain